MSLKTLKLAEKWLNYNIITQYTIFSNIINILITFSNIGQYLCSWVVFEGPVYRTGKRPGPDWTRPNQKKTGSSVAVQAFRNKKPLQT